MLKYYDGDDIVSHFQQLTKLCVSNGDNIDILTSTNASPTFWKEEK